uniref:Uncharacterized protein n=1 Tax=Panagrolaimus sp. ES5 TaxID=591445 RepID=A0AC34GSG6_9BILA
MASVTKGKNIVWWENALNIVTKFATNDLHIDPLTFLVITAFILSLIISLRGLLALMFANLDEFESLTPLIVSPSSTTSSLKKPPNIPAPPLDPIKSAFKPTKEQLIKAAHALTNDSPPLPRRPHSGKTLIVPLTASNNNNRQIRNVQNLVGTPDSRITSIEAGTTKSCATIPEDEEISIEDEDDDEEEDDRTDIDLVSIDREKAPLYEPPAPPWEQPSAPMPQRRANIKLITEKTAATRRGYLPGRDSPGLSSPEASSCGLESPADTTGSISDSFIIPSESDDSRTRNGDYGGRGGGAVYSLDTFQERTTSAAAAANDISSIETDAQSNKKFQLHRIEEESEHFDDQNGSKIHQHSTVSTQSQGFYSGRIPRSISQQLELMKK